MALQLVILFFASLASVAHSQRLVETFQAEIFYDKDDLNSGLYEGTVRGRRLFTSSAIPHGQGTIYYFNNDKYHRVNYTGDWVDGTREGNGTTNFKDGSVYRGEYFDGVEEGIGTITYPDGNVLEGEFADGNIHGNAVFKYPNGDQREGFFFDSVLDGQVIYTKNDGMIIIELWKNGEPLPEKDTIVRQSDDRNLDKTVALPVLPIVTPLSDVSTEETTTSAATISTTESQAKFDLSAIRNTIRSSDRTQVFQSESTLQREPKTQNQNMDAQRLRKITDQQQQLKMRKLRFLLFAATSFLLETSGQDVIEVEDASKEDNKGKMSFRTKQLTEEEMKSEHMPDWYRCDGCLAVSYVLHTVFEEKHKNRHKNWKLDEAGIIEEVENACLLDRYKEKYGVSVDEGVNRLKGPGVFEGYGATQFGGKLPFQLIEMCETYRGADEFQLYHKWLKGGKLHEGIKTFLCYNADYVGGDGEDEGEEDLDLNSCGKKGSSHLTEKLNAYQGGSKKTPLQKQNPPQQASKLEKEAKNQEL